MEARDSTSLKDNVSKCQLLGFRSSPPEFAMSAICMGLYGIKGKDGLGRGPLLAQGIGSRLDSPSSLYLIRARASSAIPALLTLPMAEPC